MQLDMTKGKPLKLILTFMGPLLIGNIFQQFYSIADTIIVGNYLGMDALAAVGSTGSVSFFFLGSVQGLTAGFTVLTSQRFGAGDYEAMKKSVGNAIKLSIIVAIIVTIISVMFIGDLLVLMKTPADIIDEARLYISIICGGISATVMYNLSSGILRAIGNSRAPLYFLVMATVINIGLDILFIRGFGMNVEGAAIATIISQTVSGLLCIIYIVKKVPILHINREHLKLSKLVAGVQLKIGIPMALQFSITAIGSIIAQSALNLFGTVAVSAYTAATKVEQIAMLPLFALGVTMSTYSAQNIGRNQVARIKEGARVSTFITLLYSILIAIIAIFSMPYLLKLFVRENYEQILPYAQEYIVLTSCFYFPLGVIFIYRNVMQGCSYTFAPTFGGVIELIARCVVSGVATYVMSYTVVCLVNGITWASAGIYLYLAYLMIFKKRRDGDMIVDKLKL